jgi:site-specific DNA recombinase
MSPDRGARVALYIRVSTGKQVKDGHSLEEQRGRLINHASAMGYRVVEVLVDGGESAGSLDRPGIERLRGLAAAREIDAVLVTKADRLARDLQDFLNLASELAGHRVAIGAADGSIYASTPMGRAMTQMQGVFAELERELAKVRTREGMAAARAKGVRLGRPPLGYVSDPARKGGLLPTGDADRFDAARADIRSRIAIAQETGARSWRQVADRLNAESVPTLTGKIGTWDGKRAKALFEAPLTPGERRKGEPAGV